MTRGSNPVYTFKRAGHCQSTKVSRTQNFFIAFPESTIIGGHLGADSFCLRSQPWPWRGFEVTRAENRPFFGPFLKFSNGCSSAQECDCRVKYASSGAAWPKFSKKKFFFKKFFQKIWKAAKHRFSRLGKNGVLLEGHLHKYWLRQNEHGQAIETVYELFLAIYICYILSSKMRKKPQNRQKMT